jgi:cytochrome P450
MVLSLQTLSVVGCTLLLILYFLYKAALPKPIPGIPYNQEAAGSILGDFSSFRRWHAERPELYNWIVSQSTKLNSPVIQVFMRPFCKPWVVLADFREADDIMARRTKEFGRADMFGDFFAPLLPNSHIHLPMGDEWRAHRRLIGDVLSPEFLGQVAGPQIFNTTVHLLGLWRVKSRLAQRRPFSVIEDVTHSALEVMWAVAFGSEVGATTAQTEALSSNGLHHLPQDQDVHVEFPAKHTSPAFGAIVSLTTSVEIALSSPFPRPTYWLALKLFPRLRKAIHAKDRMIKERLDKAWEKFSQGRDFGHVQSAAELIVEREVAAARKENRKPQYDTPIIRDELFGLLIAGLDTTSITVCWGLKFLTAHQRVQEKLHSLLRARYLRAASEGNLPSIQEIVKSDIPFLDATIEEIHRLGGTASIGTRVTLCDTQILGYHVPKGTDVFTVGPRTSTTRRKIIEG